METNLWVEYLTDVGMDDREAYFITHQYVEQYAPDDLDMRRFFTVLRQIIFKGVWDIDDLRRISTHIPCRELYYTGIGGNTDKSSGGLLDFIILELLKNAK